MAAEVLSSETAATQDETPSIRLTPKAAEKVRQMAQHEGLGADQGLRVAVVGGGCSGFQYALSFDQRKDGDIVTDFDGFRVLVEPTALPYIAGTTLDYVEGLHNAGFRFDNPRASRTCGCGSSFNV
ncbi:MAG TPA: iron-sulfur cluster assembly accessory protein [Candidatus Binataceae bacterium]|jgi:iron-sulfur cluster assembly accessory protein|nr:iron-sulfur cluster assembly accessory protein [Candidatus Binataceae bacterium]